MAAAALDFRLVALQPAELCSGSSFFVYWTWSMTWMKKKTQNWK